MRENWYDFFRKQLKYFDDKYANDLELLDILSSIMEDYQSMVENAHADNKYANEDFVNNYNNGLIL